MPGSSMEGTALPPVAPADVDMQRSDADDGGVPGIFAAADFEKMISRRNETIAYLEPGKNWETALSRDGELEELVHEIAQLDCTKAAAMLRKITDDSNFLRVYQQPGGSICIGNYILNLINAVAGGFVFLTSATGRKAFWRKIFPLIERFFVHGGKLLVVIPIGEISEGALVDLRTWSAVFSKLAGESGGSLRFAFVDGFENQQSWHIKLGFGIAPGGAGFCWQTGSNFNSRAVGVDGIGVRSEKQRRRAPKSAESFEVRLHDLSNPVDEEFRKQWEDVFRLFRDAASAGWLIYDTPSLNDYLASRTRTRTINDIRLAKKSFLSQHLISLQHANASGKRRDDEQQTAVGLAAGPSFAPSSDEDGEAVQPAQVRRAADKTANRGSGVLYVRVSAERQRKLRKLQQKMRDNLERPHHTARTVEERLLLANLNADILDELQQEHPAWTKSIEQLRKKGENQPRSEPVRANRLDKPAAPDSSDLSELEYSDSWDLGASDDDDGALDRLAAQLKGKQPVRVPGPRRATSPAPLDLDSPAPQAGDYIYAETDASAYEADDEVLVVKARRRAKGKGKEQVEAGASAESGDEKKKGKKGKKGGPRKNSGAPEKVGGSCDFCGRPREQAHRRTLGVIGRFPNKLACPACQQKADHGGKRYDAFDEFARYCRGELGTHGNTNVVDEMCSVCTRDGTHFSKKHPFQTKIINNDRRTVCARCALQIKNHSSEWSTWDDVMQGMPPL
ncbi:hypothetical protein Rhopal_003172-T1 [Rhodotorula paludigena]|uniref:Uncharacterized protein n=1 Tax=Rhodotorula paludigena TaxID=86838 RepID=A0AAV5GNA7_9BASI|nr:hypothetical protein Rhopal_003172-T1 [Rhodotorula paludigena]